MPAMVPVREFALSESTECSKLEFLWQYISLEPIALGMSGLHVGVTMQPASAQRSDVIECPGLTTERVTANPT